MSVYFVILLSVLSSIAHRGSKVLVSLDALQLGANSFTLGQSIATFIGPSLAGFSIDAMGFRPAFLLLASVSSTVALLAFLFAKKIVPPRAGRDDGNRGQGAFDLLKGAPLRRTLIMSGVTLTGIELFSFYLPIYGRSIGLSASGIGLVLSSYAAAAFVVRLLMQELARRFTETGVLTGSLFIPASIY